MADQINPLPRLKSALADILLIEKYNPSAMRYTPVSIIFRIDRRIELIMAANGHHHQLIFCQNGWVKTGNIELCLFCYRIKISFAVAIGQIKTAGFSYFFIVLFKTRD